MAFTCPEDVQSSIKAKMTLALPRYQASCKENKTDQLVKSLNSFSIRSIISVKLFSFRGTITSSMSSNPIHLYL